MGNLTKNLSRSEFACRCGCGSDTVDIELATAIQECADHFAAVDMIDVRIDITGPNRCEAHNAAVGGAQGSQHIYGRAADFKLFRRGTGAQIHPDLVANYLEAKYPGKCGIGRYHNRTHIDTRTNGPARWDVRSK